MLKKQSISGVITAILLAVIATEFEIVTDGPGLPVTASASVCPAGGGGGGGC